MKIIIAFCILSVSLFCFGGTVTYGGLYQAIDWQNVCSQTLVSPSSFPPYDEWQSILLSGNPICHPLSITNYSRFLLNGYITVGEISHENTLIFLLFKIIKVSTNQNYYYGQISKKLYFTNQIDGYSFATITADIFEPGDYYFDIVSYVWNPSYWPSSVTLRNVSISVFSIPWNIDYLYASKTNSTNFSSNWTEILSKNFSANSIGNLFLQGFVQFENGTPGTLNKFRFSLKNLSTGQTYYLPSISSDGIEGYEKQTPPNVSPSGFMDIFHFSDIYINLPPANWQISIEAKNLNGANTVISATELTGFLFPTSFEARRKSNVSLINFNNNGNLNFCYTSNPEFMKFTKHLEQSYINFSINKTCNIRLNDYLNITNGSLSDYFLNDFASQILCKPQFGEFGHYQIHIPTYFPDGFSGFSSALRLGVLSGINYEQQLWAKTSSANYASSSERIMSYICLPSSDPYCTMLPPVPDGKYAPGIPMKAKKISANSIHISWDVSKCKACDYILYYGDLQNVSNYKYSGAICSLGNNGEQNVSFPQNLNNIFFFIAPRNCCNDWLVDGTHGFNSNGERIPPLPSSQNFCNIKDHIRGGLCP